jgi:glyoxylase-like metal-dependent hydrolase (beta-lactamase superfamily II)
MIDLEALGCTVLERGWLSSNSIVFASGQQTAVVDTGYVTHSAQTLGLVQAALRGRPLDRIVNTHLHSDHCGGNAALSAHYPAVQTSIAPALAAAVAAWDADALSYTPTGQDCPRFVHHGVLQAGGQIELGDRAWGIHAAPGHDPDSLVLFEPRTRTLISADALWENGFGVVFPELQGQQAFQEVAATLDVIERLAPRTVIPGHGRVFEDVQGALARARTRLEKFVRDPVGHAKYAAKVLIKFKLLQWQTCTASEMQAWLDKTPYLAILHQRYFSAQTRPDWHRALLADLQRSQAMQIKSSADQETMLVNCDRP